MQLILHPAAERELDDALQWSRTHFGPQAARRPRQRITQAGELLMREPGLGSPAPGQARQFALGRHPYSLVYRVQGDTLLVVAVMHQSRGPGYWVERR